MLARRRLRLTAPLARTDHKALFREAPSHRGGRRLMAGGWSPRRGAGVPGLLLLALLGLVACRPAPETPAPAVAGPAPAGAGQTSAAEAPPPVARLRVP